MKTKVLFILLFCGSLLASAQDKTEPAEEKEAVIAVIDKFFRGMRETDSTMIRETLYTSAGLTSIGKNREDKPIVIEENTDGFLKSVGTAHEGIYDERLLNYDVRIDDLLADVRTDYEFYVSDKFSHCGMNVFQLFKSETGWKIIQITDTRRRDCGK